jgi:hypothetical protein
MMTAAAAVARECIEPTPTVAMHAPNPLHPLQKRY